MASQANPQEHEALPIADQFTIAVLKGAVEGDVTQHFGSLGGFNHHVHVTRIHGLVDDQHNPTDRARDLYERFSLAALPSGRAYLWPAERVSEVLAEINVAAVRDGQVTTTIRPSGL